MTKNRTTANTLVMASTGRESTPNLFFGATVPTGPSEETWSHTNARNVDAGCSKSTGTAGGAVKGDPQRRQSFFGQRRTGSLRRRYGRCHLAAHGRRVCIQCVYSAARCIPGRTDSFAARWAQRQEIGKSRLCLTRQFLRPPRVGTRPYCWRWAASLRFC